MYKNTIRTRSHKSKLVQDHCLLRLRKYNFTILVILAWNSLPKHFTSAETVNTFKNCIDTFWPDREVAYYMTLTQISVASGALLNISQYVYN